MVEKRKDGKQISVAVSIGERERCVCEGKEFERLMTPLTLLARSLEEYGVAETSFQ